MSEARRRYATLPITPPMIAVRRLVGRRVATAGLMGVLLVSLILAVPGLRPVVDELREMNPWWVTAAIALEFVSSVSYVVIFRLFFDRLAAPDGRALAWTSMASGVLLPGGGVGGLAIGGWLMHLVGAPTRWIVRRSSGIFFLTSAVSSAAIIVAGLLLVGGGAGPHDFARAGLPLLAAALITLLVVMSAGAAPRLRFRAGPPWLGGVVAGIHDAERVARHPSWRLVGAVGYLGFDIAVLWATFSAIGDAPPAAALILAYTIGYLANVLPVPGGIGVLDAGLAGALVLYGAAPAHAAAAVLVYHAIALWIPATGGLLAYARLRPRLAAAEPTAESALP
ncbi:MAG: hypothetical protein QOC95_1348, partial [Thermoleophilaceae bacterium]|nr:hypothetical protein [Thermoleophilaceae bacterium]